MLLKMWATIAVILVSLILSVKLFGEVRVHRSVFDAVKVIFPLLLIAEFVLTLIIIWR
jgi:hypothetical protein